jgi:hypothetical protein
VLAAVAPQLPPAEQGPALAFADELEGLWTALSALLSRLSPTRPDAAGGLLPLVQV